MKRLIELLLALAMVLSLAACGGDKPVETQGNDPGQTEPTATQPADTVKNYGSMEFTQFGNARITIVGAEFIKDDWDEDVLRIYYDYTNTGTSACSQYPNLALWYKSITQDGQECTRTQFGINDDCAIPEDLNIDCPVQPGLTSRQTMLVRCDPNGGVVEVSCYIMIGSWVYEADKVECLTFQIDPKNLPGAPEPFEMEPIMNPTYAAGLPASGTNEKGQISIDGMELTKGDEGENVLRVKLTVTNNGEESKTPVNITNGVEVYQDGLALQWFSTWDLEATEADEAYEEDLEPGETVQCNALFLLRNDHPVEVVIEDLYDELRLGMIGDVKAAMDAIRKAEQAAADAAAAAEAEARKALVGTWLQRDSDWDDTYIFNADGTGKLISGPEYEFTYSINGNILTLTYGPDDEEEFTISVDGDLLTMINRWDEELLLDKIAEEKSESEIDQTEATTEAKAEGVDWATFLIGTWEDHESGWQETFTFYADGTGVYSYYDGGLWEFNFTYEICDDDSVNLYYDDGDIGGFWIEMVDEDTIMITNSAVSDMVFVRK